MFGFDYPEDGSEDRYLQDLKKVPWVSHRWWWLVHNCLSHPLIGLAPTKRTFDFHDYTSHKMHGYK